MQRALEALRARLDGVEWAVSGSAALALHGIAIAPCDLDVLTTAAGAREIGRRLAAAVVEPVERRERGDVRGVLGRLAVEGAEVEILGDVRNRLPAGGWSEPARLAGRVEVVGGFPVMSLQALEEGYAEMGRAARVALIRAWREGPGGPSGG